jgi:hypothetical protein
MLVHRGAGRSSVSIVRRLFLSPSWLLRHLLAIFLIGLFLRLGWWQLVKGESDRGTLQNLFYGFEWPIFAATVAFFWWKMVHEELKPSDRPAPATEPGTIAPVAIAPTHLGDGRAGIDADGDATHGDEPDDEDLELAAYNRYLASLYESSARGTSR